MAEIILMANNLGTTNDICKKNRQSFCPYFLPPLHPSSRQAYEKLLSMKKPEQNSLNCEFFILAHLLPIALWYLALNV